MELRVKSGAPHERPADMAAILTFSDDRPAGSPSSPDRATGGAFSRVVRSGDFRGRHLESVLLYPVRGARAARVLVIGLGERRELTPQRMLHAAALASRRARALGAKSLALGLPPGAEEPRLAQAAAEGVVLGHYRFSAYRREPEPPLRRVEFLARRPADAKRLAGAVARGARWAEGTCLARDLAMTPGQDLVPERLAARAREVAEATGATARVLRGPQLERLGMGCLIAVGRGSVNPPCLVVLDRPPAARAKGARVPTVVLVGKGITFDTGGISLKPREDMVRMKYDMSGAAAVIGTFSALPSIEPACRVVGLLACAENMPGGRAYKPGDVLRAMDGTTIEVTNTDAEGRLVLADALCYARTLRPAAVIDLATLTGAIRIALGGHAAGLFSAEDGLAESLLAAAATTGERVWRMPLWDDYARELKSDTADLVNSAGRDGGASIAASFLARFARGLPWAHLDIASTGWSNEERPHESRGPTGFGVRLLLEWLSAGWPARSRGRREANEESRAPAAAARTPRRSTRPSPTAT